jgi:hypothetical protein
MVDTGLIAEDKRVHSILKRNVHLLMWTCPYIRSVSPEYDREVNLLGR